MNSILHFIEDRDLAFLSLVICLPVLRVGLLLVKEYIQTLHFTDQLFGS